MELGNIISEKLHEYGILGAEYKPILSLTLDDEKFKKVDEDLYYRMNEDKDSEYIPSEKEIIVGFDDFEIIIKNGTSS